MSADRAQSAPTPDYATFSTEALIRSVRAHRIAALGALRNPQDYTDPERVRSDALAEVRIIQAALDDRGVPALALAVTL